MPYLKYEHVLHEISEDKAKNYSEYIDRRLKIPIGYERLDSFKCEILKELPWNWHEYKIVDDPNIKKLSAPKKPIVDIVDKNTVRYKK